MAIPDSLLFEDEGSVHKQGRPRRSDWRAPETGGDAALARSAGGAGPGAAGWRAKGPVGLGQWSAALEREDGVAELPADSRSPRASVPQYQPEGAAGSSPGRRTQAASLLFSAWERGP